MGNPKHHHHRLQDITSATGDLQDAINSPPSTRHYSVFKDIQYKHPHSMLPKSPLGRFELQHYGIASYAQQFPHHRHHFRLRLPSLHHGSSVNMASPIIFQPAGPNRAPVATTTTTGLCLVRQPATASRPQPSYQPLQPAPSLSDHPGFRKAIVYFRQRKSLRSTTIFRVFRTLVSRHAESLISTQQTPRATFPSEHR